MSATLASLVLILFSATNAFASDNLELSPKQIQAWVSVPRRLPPKSTGEIAGIPRKS